MTTSDPNVLVAQLKELNERSRTYGRQFWQVPFAYIAGAGVALVQVVDKSSTTGLTALTALVFAAYLLGCRGWT